MRILSALDAVSPAIARTKLVLFSPFRKGRTWKLCATGYLATASAMFLPIPLIYLFFFPLVYRQAGREAAYLAAVGVVLLTAIGLVIFYLCSRLQFVFFDIVLNRGEFVAPAWRKYGRQSWKWTGIKVVLGTVFTLLFGVPVAIYFAHHVIPIMATLQPNQQPPMELFMALFGFEFGLVFGLGGLFLVHWLLTDFVLPSLALEDTTLGEAFRRFFQLVRREPGQFSLYVLLKIGLSLAGYMAQTIALYAVLLVFIIVLGIVFGIGYLILHALGVGSTVLSVLALIVAIPSYLVLIFYVTFLLIGTLLTFLQAYSLYFLGGRYPMLGDLLDRSTPPSAPPTMPPPVYSYAAPSSTL